MNRRVRIGLYTAAGALAIAAVLCLVWRAEAGDTACGSALYDTVTARPCGSPILLRRVLALVFGVVSLGTLIATSAAGVPRPRRRVRALAASLIGASAVGALITANRLLQSTRAEYCGSVLNRHHTYDVAIENRCDDLLAPHLTAAIVIGVIAIVALVAGVVLWRHSTDD